MSFDGVVTKAIINELSINVLGGRIDKIYQQENDEILLNIRNKGVNHRLLISASSHSPRIYLTDYPKKNPASPPVFCMLLRKHLSGGIILNIEQYILDRIIFIDISSTDELGYPMVKRLVIEIMGRHSNIILIDKDSGEIIDSIKRISYQISRLRQVLPGLIYNLPPSQNKINPLENTNKIFFDLLSSEKGNTQIYKFFYYNYMGLSPLISKEICFNAGIDMDRTVISLDTEDLENLFTSFSDLMLLIKSNHFRPLFVTDNSANIIAFYCLNLNQFNKASKTFIASISGVLDKVYKNRDTSERVEQKSKSIRKLAQTKLDRSLSKLGKQKNELLESKDRQKYKIYADLISANIYRIPERIDNIDLENFYETDMSVITVPLNNRFTPIENAQQYYKKYSKLKAAESKLSRQILQTRNEIKYLEAILFAIDNSSEVEDIKQIKDELISEGYIRSKKNTKKQKHDSKPKSLPHHYVSSDNLNIYVGKNNRQNDHLTLKFASKDDIWLHVQNVPGSHVIIQNLKRDIPKKTIEEAALLAAFHSKSRNDKKVLIDYTEKKNVKKPRGAKPGMVIYDNHHTIVVTPSPHLIKQIKKVDN